MTDEPILPSDRYVVDLDAQALRPLTDSGLGEPVDLALLTDGEFSISGTFIRNNLNGQIVRNLSRTGSDYVDRMSNGALYITRDGGVGDINTRSGQRSWEMFSGEVTIAVEGVGVVTLQTPDLNARAMGTRQYVEELPDGTTRELSITESAALGELTPEELPAGIRLATPQEALEKALQGWLLDKMRNLLDDIVAADIVDDNGDPIDSQSAAAAFLASAAAGSMAVSIVTRL